MSIPVLHLHTPGGGCTCGCPLARVSEQMMETAERAGHDEGMSSGWDASAEAMRTACWEEVQRVCADFGITERLFQDLKTAILEKASP
ncbi:hypothetical protein [Hyalangium sp.]|uniref:hypothetical protein n=1 Tax=Hyalangium sp. TaxID=2028555 RepID=UPI002D41E43D|nr:hypothetical protein [Hyalangium sp.]HYH96899.1 hypothetical protein [Hyalangium sp.]